MAVTDLPDTAEPAVHAAAEAIRWHARFGHSQRYEDVARAVVAALLADPQALAALGQHHTAALAKWNQACDPAGLPHDDPEGFVRHHRGNAALAAVAEVMTAGLLSVDQPHHVEWVAFTGGPDPDNATKIVSTRYQEEAFEWTKRRFPRETKVASRPVYYGPWTVHDPAGEGR